MEIETALKPGEPNGYSNGEADPESTNGIHGHNGDDDDVERTSDMWVASAYSITAIVGVGVLGLPQTMVFLTWGPGMVVLLLAFSITYFTLKQLTMLHEFEFVGNKKKRYGTYYKLGQRAFGERRGLWIILPLQMVVEISLDILYTVAAGEAFNRIYDHFAGLCNPNRPVHIFVWFAVFAAIQIILSIREPTFESIKWIVIIAAIMSVGYSTIAWITVVSVGGPEAASGSPIPVHHRLPERLLVDHCVPMSYSASNSNDPLKLNHADLVFRAFNAMGIVAFAYTAHNVVLEIQNGIPSTRTRSSEVEMLRGVKITYAVVAMCYLPMGLAFYKTYGNQISQNALSFLQYQTGASKGLVTSANVMLIIHLIGSYQIFGMPVFNLLEFWYRTLIEPKFRGSFPIIRRGVPYLIRPLYIVLTTVLAMIFPYFSPLLGFFGGFAIAPTTYFLPCIIWLKIKKPERWSIDWCFNWGCIVLGVLLMIVASIGGFYVLVQQSLSDKYRLWTPSWLNSTLYSTSNQHNPLLTPPNTWQHSILQKSCNCP